MRRREFITFVSGAAAAWPLAARGQQPAMPVIGWLNSETPSGYAPFVSVFRQGVTEAEFVETAMWRLNTAGPRVITIDYRHWRPSWFAIRWR
jgi:hypothetical protein